MAHAPRAVADVGVNPAFWRGRTVLVTGHTGFKGSWTIALLKLLGAETIGFSLPDVPSPSLFPLIDGGSLCDDRRGDVRDREALANAVAAARPEIVLHMAAQPLVRESYANPVDTYATNVMGTVHLLEACRAIGSVRSVVVVTTDKCYENKNWVWGYREDDRLGGADPYSNSKAACELVVDAYRRSFFSAADAGLHLASARAGNVIGGGDYAADRLIPDAVRAFSAGESLRIRNPMAVRPWQHVLDPVAGYLTLAERLHDDRAYAESWNFGPSPDENASVATVADMAAARWGETAAWLQDDGHHPHEAATLKLDSTKARLALGWTPHFDLDAAVATTVDWYAGHRRGGDPRRLTFTQIEDYLGRRNPREGHPGSSAP